MQLKPLIAILALLATMTTGGCVIHFPLGENGPTLESSESSPSSAPTEPNTNNTVKGNSADTPE